MSLNNTCGKLNLYEVFSCFMELLLVSDFASCNPYLLLLFKNYKDYLYL